MCLDPWTFESGAKVSGEAHDTSRTHRISGVPVTHSGHPSSRLLCRQSSQRSSDGWRQSTFGGAVSIDSSQCHHENGLGFWCRRWSADNTGYRRLPRIRLPSLGAVPRGSADDADFPDNTFTRERATVGAREKSRGRSKQHVIEGLTLAHVSRNLWVSFPMGYEALRLGDTRSAPAHADARQSSAAPSPRAHHGGTLGAANA
jgi:hypothetical protein